MADPSVLEIVDDGDGVTSSILLTPQQAVAVLAMAPGDAVVLDDGVTVERHDPDDGRLWFVGNGVRPCAYRRGLLDRLRAIARGDA